MRKFSLLLLLPVTLLFCWVQSSPTHLGSLEFDNFEADLDSLSYEVEEEDLGDYTKSHGAQNKERNSNKKEDISNGFKKKDTLNKGTSKKHNVQNFKKVFKSAGVHDEGAYDDEDTYGLAEKAAGKAVSIKGKEDRTYRKGTKTRGFHRVHHKDEYKKDKIFYEDDETKGAINKVGAKGQGFIIGAGVEFNKGRFHHDRRKGAYGKKRYSDKGSTDEEFNSNSDARTFENYFNYE